MAALVFDDDMSAKVATSPVFYLIIIAVLIEGLYMACNWIVNYLKSAAYGKPKIGRKGGKTSRENDHGVQEKRMYWVRHGDSTWNGVMGHLKPGKDCRLGEYIAAQFSIKSNHINAALSDEGLKQVVCLGRGGRVHQQKCVGEGQISLPDVYVVSPMRRAVQTFAGAVTGFAQQNNLVIETACFEQRLALRYKSNDEQGIETNWIFIQFDADIREIKKLATERDCVGTDDSKTVKGMLQHAKLNASHYKAELAESLKDMNKFLDELSKHSDGVAFHGTMLSGTQEKGAWWNSGAEPEISYKKRLSDFMSRCSDNASIFSHSFTMKMVARYFIDPSSLTTEIDKEVGEWFAKNKVFNTGGMRLELQFNGGNGANEGKVTHVGFVGEGQTLHPPNKNTISDYLAKSWTLPHGKLTREDVMGELEMQDMTKKRSSEMVMIRLTAEPKDAPRATKRTKA